MWKIKYIKANNLLSFKELSFEIPQDKTTLVFGRNLDNETQGSNGSGKSALIEAISLVLTGEPLRKVKVDEIINDTADTAMVDAELYNINETLHITRQIYRKGSQKINISISTSECEDTENIVLSSVSDYNSYILDKIGINKEDLYSNYILSRNRYSSFLLSSDKDKKELINRFSNGIMVDESIDALNADIKPVQDTINELTKTCSYYEGKVETLKQQVENEVNNRETSEIDRKTQISDIQSRIEECKINSRTKDRQRSEYQRKEEGLGKLEEQIVRLEELKLPYEEYYTKVQKIWTIEGLDEIGTLYINTDDIRRNITKEEDNIKEVQIELNKYNNELQSALSDVNDISDKFNLEQDNIDIQRNKITEQAKKIKADIQNFQSIINSLSDKQVLSSKRILELKKILGGVIECPNCKHQWIEKCDKSPDSLNKEIQMIVDETTRDSEKQNLTYTEIEEYEKTLKELREQYRNVSDNLLPIQQELNKAKSKVSDIQHNITLSENKIKTFESSIGLYQLKLQSISERFTDSLINNITVVKNRIESNIKKLDSEIEALSGSVTALESSLKILMEDTFDKRIESLKSELKENVKILDNKRSEYNELNYNLTELLVQEKRFIEFKTWLANTKIEALAQMTNSFLEAIGSDIRISFSGYTVLRTGKIRDKISISLLRDGTDGGSFGKWSAGEQARVNLANILALWKLTNNNCEDNGGLDILIIDELLDACDEEGLTSMFNALNKLGITSLVVSHGNIIESYPHRLTITKQHGESSVS